MISENTFFKERLVLALISFSVMVSAMDHKKSDLSLDMG